MVPGDAVTEEHRRHHVKQKEIEEGSEDGNMQSGGNDSSVLWDSEFQGFRGAWQGGLRRNALRGT